jgi:DNA-binding MarR family transcriptional regulator
MAVNPVGQSAAGDSVDEDLRQLVRFVRPVFAGLKRGGPVPASFHETFERASLGPRHIPLLFVLALDGPLSVSELAGELGLSLSTTSLMVGELSRAGMVERAEDQEDRRRTIVRLNESLRQQLDAHVQERLAPFRRTLQRLSPRARSSFLEGWRILSEETARDAGSDGDQPHDGG